MGVTMEKMTEDNIITKPTHYTKGIECWDYIVSHNMSYLQGNIIKYLTRYKLKGKPVQDLLKARAYIDRLILKEREDEA